jgi:hypothetical protein
MTDLISRPSRVRGTRPRIPENTEPAPRPLSASGAIGGLVAAAATLALMLAVALTGWFLADGGAHGQTTDALRVGADGWLAGHGSRVVVSGTPFGITPLAITLVLLVAAFRAGRWCVRGAAPADDRTLAGAVATFVCAYLVVVVVVAVLSSEPGATTSLPRAVLGAGVVALAGGGLGLAVGTDRVTVWLRRVPVWAREVATGGVAGALALFAAAAAVTALSLVVHFNEAATMLSALHLSTGDEIAYAAVAVMLIPNAVLFGASYLLGPGFAVGVGTTVSPTAVSLGAVPAFPLLAALPHEGPTPGWLILILALPIVCAAVGVVRSRRDGEPAAYDIAAARGAGSGFVAGVLVTLAIALSGGPMGTGRLTDIGPPVAEVFVFATGLMVVGGLLGGLIATWRLRRRAA